MAIIDKLNKSTADKAKKVVAKYDDLTKLAENGNTSARTANRMNLVKKFNLLDSTLTEIAEEAALGKYSIDLIESKSIALKKIKQLVKKKYTVIGIHQPTNIRYYIIWSGKKWMTTRKIKNPIEAAKLIIKELKIDDFDKTLDKHLVLYSHNGELAYPIRSPFRINAIVNINSLYETMGKDIMRRP